MLKKCLILWISYFVVCSNAGKVSWIKPCAQLDSACLLKSAEFAMPYVVNGIEELGIPGIDPMFVKDTDANTGDLKVRFTNVTFSQLSKCEFKSFTRDPVKLTASVTVHCPTVIKGQYKMSGSMLYIEVFGEGDFSIAGGIMRTSTVLQLKTFTKDDKTYYKISSFDYEFEPLTTYKLKFENLYNGDEEKSKPVEKIMDGASKELILDIGKTLMKEGMINLVKFIDYIFKVVPVNEMEVA